jgi:hypothetical protein
MHQRTKTIILYDFELFAEWKADSRHRRNESQLGNFFPSRVKRIAPQVKPDSLHWPTMGGETNPRAE